MKVAVTGATGFLGRYIVRKLLAEGNTLRCWHRPESDRSGLVDQAGIEWIAGELNDEQAAAELVTGCDAVVHSGLYRTSGTFRGDETNISDFLQKNLLGTVQLIEAARQAKVPRFVFISTCAVHEKILVDRPLDEHHPLLAKTHYGAHKAAIEQFVHSYGLGMGYDICALRPTGIYGLSHPPQNSKWFQFVSSVVRGEPIHCQRGGKEVHASDVASAVDLLLHADDIAGEVYSCYDRYISEWDVAQLAKDISGSSAVIDGQQTRPKHQIVSDKIKALGFRFGGEELLRDTVTELVRHCS